MQKLRDEIVEAQKARLDLVKWKLIIVSALGAAALGVGPLTGGSWNRNLLALLALVPPVSLYVDSLCYHLTLRIIVIGAFLRSAMVRDLDVFATSDDLRVFHAYETFASAARARHGAFSLEDWALSWSTMALSLGCAALGASLARSSGDEALAGIPLHGVLLVSGAAGTALAYLLYAQFRYRKQKLETFDGPADPTRPPP